MRQIVAGALEEGEGETKLVHAQVQIARLEPALRLAARGVADGDLRAVDRLLRVLDRLDKYSAVAGADAPYDENARARLLAKLNSMAERIRRGSEEKEARETPGDEAPDDEDDEAQSLENSPDGEATLDAP